MGITDSGGNRGQGPGSEFLLDSVPNTDRNHTRSIKPGTRRAQPPRGAQPPGRAKLPNPSRLRAFYLSYLSTPTSDRPIYRAICRQRVQKILELGIGTGQRAVRMIELAGLFCPLPEIEFSGIDLFESRSAAAGPGMSLKMAHRLLGRTGAGIQLIPGDPYTGLARAANRLGRLDLVIVSARLDPRSLALAWFYVPRLLHDRTHVFQERLLPGGRTSLRLVAADEVRTLAAGAVLRRAA